MDTASDEIELRPTYRTLDFLSGGASLKKVGGGGGVECRKLLDHALSCGNAPKNSKGILISFARFLKLGSCIALTAKSIFWEERSLQLCAFAILESQLLPPSRNYFRIFERITWIIFLESGGFEY